TFALLASVAVVVAVSAARPSARADRVAVLPFENETGDPTLDASGRMAADWTTQSLAQTGAVDLIDYRSARRTAADSSSDSTSGDDIVSRRAGADMLVRGVVFREDDRLRVHVRLLRGRGGAVLHE
ncbi:MAG TPA: hypothetical protein VMN60_01950, partial [Longimicrobiales bacterium]|nr:hypothetical protein [Longimicrobiales bacterium]